MKSLLASLVVVALVAGVGLAQEGKKEKRKPNPTGTWTWTSEFGGQSREVTLKLKLGEEGKLSGVLIRGDQETKITDGTFKDNTVSFKVERERNGKKMVSTYNGKLERGTIKGKIESTRDGKPQSRDWEAKRVRTKKAEEKKEKTT